MNFFIQNINFFSSQISSKINRIFYPKFKKKIIQNIKDFLSKTKNFFHPKNRYFIHKYWTVSESMNFLLSKISIYFYPKILFKTYTFFCPKYRFFYPQILHKLFIFFYLKYQDFFFKEQKNFIQNIEIFLSRKCWLKIIEFFFSIHIFSR